MHNINYIKNQKIDIINKISKSFGHIQGRRKIALLTVLGVHHFGIDGRVIGGDGGPGILVDVSQNFRPFVEVCFSQKWAYFQNFQDISTNTTPKINFIAFLGDKSLIGWGSPHFCGAFLICKNSLIYAKFAFYCDPKLQFFLA